MGQAIKDLGWVYIASRSRSDFADETRRTEGISSLLQRFSSEPNVRRRTTLEGSAGELAFKVAGRMLTQRRKHLVEGLTQSLKNLQLDYGMCSSHEVTMLTRMVQSTLSSLTGDLSPAKDMDCRLTRR